MIVPKYWAESSLQQRQQGKQFTVRRFGWSDASQEDAQHNADTRAREAVERVLAGEKIERREARRPYNGAHGVPIREEIVATHGETIITRNSYGALCLNTPNVLFADVDFSPPGSGKFYAIVGVLILAAAVAIGISNKSIAMGVSVAILGLLGWTAAATGLEKLWLAMRGGPKILALRRINTFMAAHADWHIRLYETPAGYRLLVLHRTFDPAESAVRELFTTIGADKVYVRMCINQHCFRARVSPKPWRIGVEQHMKPRPGTWPISPDRLPDRQHWIEKYDRAAEKFASCRFIQTLGDGRVDSTADAVRELHDDYCKATRALPIA